MPASINRISALLLLAFALLAGALGYWAASGHSLTARDDNPRRILAERRIHRGAIIDHDGQVIVETVGERGEYVRRTLYPDAVPVTGYYSINYGTSGVEQAYDDTLRGIRGIDETQARIDALLHIHPAGRAVQLTIDLDAQRIADALLNGHTGAIVVLSVPDNQILALSSRPTFDPNTLDENWEALRADPTAPLLNRATQGQYQPGTALQPVLLAEALRRDAASLDAAPELPTVALRVDGRMLTCRSTDGVVTLGDALREACPAPFARLGAVLGSRALWEMVVTWGLTDTHPLGIQSTTPLSGALPLQDTPALLEFAAGQGRLTVTPLHMAVVASTLAAGGVMESPRLVSATQALNNTWQPVAQPAGRRVVPFDIARKVTEAMPHSNNITWHAGVGLSGSSRLLWFIGFTPTDSAEYAAAILIEQGADQPERDRDAIEIGQALLSGLSH